MARIMMTLRRSIAAICVDNYRLIRLIGRVRDYYVSDAKWPKGEPRLSEALRCERNGAHKLLSDLREQLKIQGRVPLPQGWIVNWLALTSRRLLIELVDLVMLLPSEYDVLTDGVRHAVNAAMTKEDEITNYLLGDLNDDDKKDDDVYNGRIAMLIGQLKNCFHAIASSVEDVEVQIWRHRERDKSTGGTRRTAVDSRNEIMRKDRQDIRTEVRRRCMTKCSRGIATTMRGELTALCHDEAWRRRCSQWSFETLYSYIIRSNV